MSFKVGDRVVIVRSPLARMVGRVATITALTELRGGEWCSQLPVGTPLWRLSIPSVHGPGNYVSYPAAYLERVPDDGHLAGEWDELTRRLCKPKVDA